jgi:hypothetical protein
MKQGPRGLLFDEEKKQGLNRLKHGPFNRCTAHSLLITATISTASNRKIWK